MAFRSSLLACHAVLRRVKGSVQRVFLNRRFFLVPRFSSALHRLAREILIRFRARILRVLASIHLTTNLSWHVLPLSSRPFKRRIVTVRIVLVVAIDVGSNGLHGSVLPRGQLVNEGSGAQV